MKIGFIGAGSVASSIGRDAIAQGHEVVLSSRSTDRATTAARRLGAGAKVASIDEVAQADIVILAVPWQQIGSALGMIEDWRGKLLVDATNPFTQIEPTLVLEDLEGRSASDIVAARAAGARVVKAFNSITMKRYDEGPTRDGSRRVLFVSGDDVEAKSTVVKLIESFGFVGIDLGGLTSGGLLQQPGGPLAGLDLLLA